MLRQQEGGEYKRNHVTIRTEEEERFNNHGNCDDTPTKSNSTDAEVCGLSLLQVKKSINFDLSRENSSDSFIVRDALERKDMFFRVENFKFDDLFDFSKMEESNSFALKPKTGSVEKINNRKIALFRFAGTVHAIDEKCPHLGGPLHLGDIENLGEAKLLCVVCPWHRWKIDLTTGKVKMPSRQPPLRNQIYPTRVEDDGTIFVGFDEIDDRYFEGDADF